MGDVAVENPANTVAPHKRQPPTDSIPNIDSLEGSGNDGGDEYSTLKRYQRHLEYETDNRFGRVEADDELGTSISKKNTSKMSSGEWRLDGVDGTNAEFLQESQA